MARRFEEHDEAPSAAFFAWLLAIAFVCGAFTMFLACMFYK